MPRTRWDGIEKPYEGLAWLRYLIDEFLGEGARSAVAEQYGLARNHVLDGMVVGERHETGELFAIEVAANQVSRRTLIPRRPGVDEYGYGPEIAERRERGARLAARRRRYEAALAEDRAAAG